jgi:hypothetical protein
MDVDSCGVLFVMQTSGTLSCLPAERAGQVPELEVEAGGQHMDSSSSMIETPDHDRIKAHEKHLIMGMYLDLTPLQGIYNSS